MIGIPRSIFYYYDGYKWEVYLKKLNIPFLVSPPTNKEILNDGKRIANDEMCLSMKNYLGHVSYLVDRCDYILVPRIDNYGHNDQMCTNFTSLYDIVNNLFNIKVLNYNIDYMSHQTEKKGFMKIGKLFGKTKKECITAYEEAIALNKERNRQLMIRNIHKLKTKKKHILVVGHKYNLLDNYIGGSILSILKQNNVDIIYSSYFNSEDTSKRSKKYSSNLYWKYSKEEIGSLGLSRIDGIVFFSTFPCGLDSLVNELVMRKISTPYINIVVDDLSSMSGFETRIESFIDLINERNKYENSVSYDG